MEVFPILLFLSLRGKKVKLSLCLINYAVNHENVPRSENMATTIVDLGSRWSCVVNFLSRPVYARGNHRGTHLIGGWLAPVPVWTSSSPNQESNSDRPASSPRSTDWAIPALFRSKYYPQHLILNHSEPVLFSQSGIKIITYMWKAGDTSVNIVCRILGYENIKWFWGKWYRLRRWIGRF
jgi:hypothetical protein